MHIIHHDDNPCQQDASHSFIHENDSAYIGFYTTPQVANTLRSVAADYNVSVAQLLAAFAAHADVLCWFVPLGEDRPAEKESRQLAG